MERKKRKEKKRKEKKEKERKIKKVSSPVLDMGDNLRLNFFHSAKATSQKIVYLQ